MEYVREVAWKHSPLVAHASATQNELGIPHSVKECAQQRLDGIGC